MVPAKHLDWFAENIEWFLNLSTNVLAIPVPACPGWNVENVVNHLGYGVGLAYPHALVASPTCSRAEAFANVQMPTELPSGQDALGEFERHMDACLKACNAIHAGVACYTYEGPGLAAFWFRRAAIETSLHRLDVAEALVLAGDSSLDTELSDVRAIDAIAESVKFALPFAASLCEASIPAISVCVVSTSTTTSTTTSTMFQLGTGDIAATISGDALQVLSTLWGRSSDGVAIEGNRDVADQWLSVIEQAFAPR